MTRAKYLDFFPTNFPQSGFQVLLTQNGQHECQAALFASPDLFVTYLWISGIECILKL
jgi:hypothetical protein